MTNWTEKKAWSDQFISEIKSILGCCFDEDPSVFAVGPIEEDCHRNTDLCFISFGTDPGVKRISVRIRSANGYMKYSHEFTIRSSLPSGNKTELEKVLSGLGDYSLYGFGNDGERLSRWTLFDLDVFRAWHPRQTKKNGGRDPGRKRYNKGSNDSEFTVFSIADLPDDFVIARHPE